MSSDIHSLLEQLCQWMHHHFTPFPKRNILSHLENIGSIPQVLQAGMRTSNLLLNVVLVLGLKIVPE